MITIHVEIDGRMSKQCSFYDYDHQSYLLPCFDVGDSLIDISDVTEFHINDMIRLKNHLVPLLLNVSSMPEEWTITTVYKSTNESHNFNNLSICVNRFTIIKIISDAISMIDYALSHNGKIIFCGD